MKKLSKLLEVKKDLINENMHLNFAIILSILVLTSSVILAYLKHPTLAGIAITIPIGVAVSNMLGFKASGQTKKNK